MDPSKLKVIELRAALSERGLDTKGNKPVLVERLRKALEVEEEEEERKEVQEETTTTQQQDYGQDKALYAENTGDTAFKETQERIAEAARQPPRTPSRASRSSSIVTPTKVSTRNTSRIATTPNSSKQSTPSKLQYIEKSYDTLTTISESTSEEHVVQDEGISKWSPEKPEEKWEDNASNVIQNKIYSPLSVKSQEEEAKHVNILEDNKYEANVLQVPVTEPSVKASTIACVDRFSIPREEHETKESSVDEVYKVQQLSAGSLEEETEVKEGSDGEKVQNTFGKGVENKISIEKEDTKCVADTYNVKNTVNIPQVEQHVIPDQVDKSYNEEKIINDDYTVQDETMDVSVNVDDVDEKADNISQDEQITETKQEDASKLDAEESNQKEYNDRKRKRSPSPAEVHQASPVPQKVEDEPDFDGSAVVLSWYDSDLNLIINKEGFFSATPMHNGDFCHIWAGARASHGFANGKVYYEAKITEHHFTVAKDEQRAFRLGWSVLFSSMQLGEERLSYAYTSSGQKGTDSKFTDYGLPFGKDDVVGCYLDMTPENTVELSYTVNGKDLGTAFSISKEELGDRPLFPHILSKNCTFVCNFGQDGQGWCEQIPGYTLVGNVESKDKVAGPRRPDAKAHCEVIVMCGLPAAGKTTWARKHAADHPIKLYNILALHNLVEKTGDVALSGQENTQREVIDKCNRALDQLIDVASDRRRNYILDQKSNVNSSVQRRKIRSFCEYQRKAVVVVPTDEEYSQRLSAHSAIEGNVSESDLKEMKANFTAPWVGETFDAVEWVELDEEEGKKIIEKYNKEGKEAGFGQQATASKRPRLDKTEASSRETRDSRNNRDTRDHNRRNNYQDRGRNPPPRRGPNLSGWRGERPQRYIRHGYALPPWRLRGRPGPAMIRGVDRRAGVVDRRSGNDRNRSVAPRQGGWGSMSGSYQGSQQSGGWGQDWSSNQSQGNWNQQSSWGQQQWGGNWKGYGHTSTSYSQAGYSQQGYGNGNWNSSWNQQYYNNQYWGQQPQSGQTTAAGSQADFTSEMVATTSTDMGGGYSYSQE